MPDNTYKFFHVFKERCQQAGFIPNIVFSSPNFATVFALLKQYHNWIGYSFDFYIDQVMDEVIVTLPVEDGGWSWDVYIAYKPIVRSNYVAQFVKMKVENWGIALSCPLCSPTNQLCQHSLKSMALPSSRLGTIVYPILFYIACQVCYI